MLQNHKQLSQTCWHFQQECWSNYWNCQLLAPSCNNKITSIYPGLFESTFHSKPSPNVLWTHAQAIYRKNFTHPWQAATYGMNHWAFSRLSSSGRSRMERGANMDGTGLILSSLTLVFLHSYSGPPLTESKAVCNIFLFHYVTTRLVCVHLLLKPLFLQIKKNK